MASKFGGAPYQPKSKFGGIPVITAELHDGTILKFPDGTPKSVVQDTVKRYLSGNVKPPHTLRSMSRNLLSGNGRNLLAPHTLKSMSLMQQADTELFQKQARDAGAFQSFVYGAGQGALNIARGAGLADQPQGSELKAREALEQERPYSYGAGEMIGEAAPLAPVPVGGIYGLAVKRLSPWLAKRLQVFGAGALGATEGTLIERGERGENAKTVQAGILGGTIASVSEILFPYIGRFVGASFRRMTGRMPEGALLTPDGLPTPELQEALDSSGVSFDQLSQEAIGKCGLSALVEKSKIKKLTYLP